MVGAALSRRAAEHEQVARAKIAEGIATDRAEDELSDLLALSRGRRIRPLARVGLVLSDLLSRRLGKPPRS